MVNQQTLQGNWNELKGKLRNKWGQLTNDDLQQARGSVDQLIGLIQRKTGEDRNTVEKFLEEATADGATAVSEAADTAREYAQQAMETVQERTKQAADTFKKSYDQAAQSFRHGYERPKA
jgi:uncharacterized protein YjbJ (UPF0337 family)